MTIIERLLGPGRLPGEGLADEVRERFGPFIRDRVNPGAVDRDVHAVECAPQLMREAREVGLLTYALPPELDGGGADLFEWGLVLEQLGYLSDDCSFPALLSARVWLIDTLFGTGRADLLDRYVRPMAAAERFGAFAYSDGADPFAFSSTARRAAGTVVINGHKPIVTGAASADFFLVFLNDDETGDLIGVLVERADAGVVVEPVDSMGMRALGLGSLRMEDVRVPEERLVVEGDGLTFAQHMLNARRVLLVAGVVGAMQALHEHCIDKLSRTHRYGAPLVEMQNVQRALGLQHISIESSRAVLHRALSVLGGHTGELDNTFDPIISAAKHEITDRGVELGISALRLLGGHGYLRGRAERYLRDTCGLLAAAGTQDVLEIDLGLRAIASAGSGS